MDTFYSTLEAILKKDPRFIDQEGDLLKSEVMDKARKADRKLMELLLANAEVKKKFFIEVKKHWIFDADAFVSYIQDKHFLSDSYTKYKNKIGLTVDGKFLNERKEVALVWPFKDCVLEGGMTKEDEKRKEIFFNEILAHDEIDKLFAPKVLTNWKRYTAKGEKEVKEIKRDKDGTIRENLVIKGNNLLALHSLKAQFQGKVKLIYIDPPYNTGGDSFGYNDNFNHSTWLTFMKNRLEVAKELLSDDGSIWINIDDGEAHYLKVLSDEVFGRENFVANVVWHKTYTVSSDSKKLPNSHDQILIFQKSPTFSRNLLPRSEKQNSLYKNNDGDGRGPYRTDNLSVKTYSEAYDYPITNPVTGKEYNPPRGRCWVTNKVVMKRWIAEKRVFFGKDGEGAPQLKRYLNEVQGGVVPTTWWDYDEVGHNDQSRKEIKQLFGNLQSNGEGLFTTPKPEKLIQRILQIGSNESDIVLDFFAGSATTGAVAMKMKRQFILVEQMDYVENVTIERLKKVVKGEQGGISKEVNWQGGGDFVYCELMQYNERFIEQIEKAKDTKALLKIWEEMKKKSFLKYNVDLQEFDASIGEFKKLSLAKQKEVLVEILNKNQLYVGLSEMEDGEFKVGKGDNEVNGEFYG